MRPVLPEQGFAVELGGQGLVFGGHSLRVLPKPSKPEAHSHASTPGDGNVPAV
jgi:hypothetical protein